VCSNRAQQDPDDVGRGELAGVRRIVELTKDADVDQLTHECVGTSVGDLEVPLDLPDGEDGLGEREVDEQDRVVGAQAGSSDPGLQVLLDVEQVEEATFGVLSRRGEPRGEEANQVSQSPRVLTPVKAS
jgi:hypothetical protein